MLKIQKPRKEYYKSATSFRCAIRCNDFKGLYTFAFMNGA